MAQRVLAPVILCCRVFSRMSTDDSLLAISSREVARRWPRMLAAATYAVRPAVRGVLEHGTGLHGPLPPRTYLPVNPLRQLCERHLLRAERLRLALPLAGCRR